jgi:pimeloyl-ACP methyl ester carboxylesterase
MRRNLLPVFTIIILFFNTKAFSQAGDCPYPVIFLHGWTGSESSFSPVYNNSDFQGIWGDLSDIFHAVVNAQEGTYIWGADGIEGTNDDDVLVTFNNETNDLAPGCLYAINLDNYWNESTSNPQIWIHDGGSPSFFASDSNESAIYKQGYALGQMIKKVLEANPGKEKVIIVSHSMGGLESREYLQRTDANGDHLWWVEPSYSGGHKVAKLVTTCTPHRGSNSMGNVSDFGGHEEEDFRDGFPDLTSEAVRDLRYSYGCGFLDLDDCPGNYLFGGDEDDIGTWFYANADVDCDGDESSPNIVGININGQIQGFSQPWHGTYDNPAIPLPTDIRYTWITSDIPIDNGDGVVAWSRQWLYEGSTPKPSDGTAFRLADSLLTDYSHISITSDVNTILRGMDEGDFPQFAWDVKTDIQYAGIPQYRSVNTPDGPATADPDWFKFTMPQESIAGLDIELIPNNNLGGRIDFFTYTPGPYTEMNVTSSYGMDFTAGTNTVNFFIPKNDLTPGVEYFFRIKHNGTGVNTWKTPYRFLLTPVSPLPLELITFEGKANKENIILAWTTMNEVNSAYFEIERLSNGLGYQRIGSVQAQQEASPIKSYTFTDKNAVPGANYYRLKIFDQNGTFVYSHQISVRLDMNRNRFILFPNPAKDKINLRFESNSNAPVSISISNAIRKYLINEQIQSVTGKNQHELDVSILSQGIYFIEFRQKGVVEMRKFSIAE